MNNYDKLYKEFYKKFAAESDIEAAKKLIEGNTPIPVDSHQTVSNPYSEYGKVISRHALPKPPDYNAAPIKSKAQNVVTKPAKQTTTAVKREPATQNLPRTNIQYRQYAENDPLVRKYKRRLKRMGFARFDENGPWIATPHGTSIMRELPQGLDRGAIQTMLEEGKVPVGVFEAATLLAQRAKATQQKASVAQVAQQTAPVTNTPYQTPQRVNVPQQQPPPTNPYSQPATRRSTRRRPPTREEALRMREERINRDILKKHPVLAQIEDYKRKRKAIEDDRNRMEQEYHRQQLDKMTLVRDIMNKHIPSNPNYQMTPEQKARWDFYRQNPEFFTMGNIEDYYNQQPPLPAQGGLPDKTIGEKLDDFYTYDLVPAYGDIRNNIRNFLYDLNTPFRHMSYLMNN